MLMKTLKKEQNGFIPLLLLIIVIIAIAIYLVYLRVHKGH